MTKLLLAAVAALALAGCASGASREPVVRTVEVKVQVPVPCPALTALGPEPAYPDTDAAIRAASNPLALAALYAKGRLMRIQRLTEYEAVKSSCSF